MRVNCMFIKNSQHHNIKSTYTLCGFNLWRIDNNINQLCFSGYHNEYIYTF